jgi:SOS-response transcriptional repressor LexA
MSERGIAVLSASTVHRYEREGRIPDALGLLGLAELYRVDVDQLWAALVSDLEGRRVPKAEELIAPPVATPVEIQGIEESFAAVELLDDPIAAGPPIEIEDAARSGHVPFPKRLIDRIGAPLCVRVDSFERSMIPTIQPGETVLLDCSDAKRMKPVNDRIYAVNVPTAGATLKRVFRLDRGLLLVADNVDKSEYPTLRLELVRGKWEVRPDNDDDDAARRAEAEEYEDSRLWKELIVGEVMWKGQAV